MNIAGHIAGQGSAQNISLESVHVQGVENATNIALVQQSVTNLQATVNNLAKTVDDYIRSDLASKQPNWSLWIAFGTLLIALCTGGWMVLTLKINAEVRPMGEKIAVIETSTEMLSRAASANQDKISLLLNQSQNSIDDRGALNKKVDTLMDRYTTMLATEGAHNSERLAHEIEIETQFDADSQLRNIQFADQQRLNRMLWNQHQKVLGEYPAAPFFFPNISKRNHTSLNGSTSGGK